MRHSKNYSDNKYTKTYYQIIERAQARPRPEGYTERHHIIPECIGGKRRVRLTFKEHWTCHHLLVKMVNKKLKPKMIDAMFGIAGRQKSLLPIHVKQSIDRIKKMRLTSKHKSEILNI